MCADNNLEALFHSIVNNQVDCKNNWKIHLLMCIPQESDKCQSNGDANYLPC